MHRTTPEAVTRGQSPKKQQQRMKLKKEQDKKRQYNRG
jgi:hypothetical protein